jgi:hypothetical protein
MLVSGNARSVESGEAIRERLASDAWHKISFIPLSDLADIMRPITFGKQHFLQL